jgi:carbamoyltransferase
MNILGLYGAVDWDANQSYDDHQNLTWVHDAGVTLLINGKHICSISEERLTRIKHDGNFPINSIEYCLQEGNIAAEDVNLICIPSMCLEYFYRQLKDGIIEKKIKSLFPNAVFKIISHHLSHAASAVFSSKFNEGTFITLDGAGSVIYSYNQEDSLAAETNSIGYFNKENGIFRFFNGISGTNNFGSYYHTAAHKIYCKKVRNHIDAFDEKYRESWDGKIMGLSAYGNLPYKEEYKEYQLSSDLHYNEVPYVVFDYKSHSILKTADEQAYILQKNFETALVDYIGELKAKSYLEDNLCLAGGSFLNVLGNSSIRNNKLVQNMHIPSCPNDTGLHYGAALFGAFQNKEKIELPENIALLGKEYTNGEIEKELTRHKVTFTKYEDFEELCYLTADYIAQNKIIAWFQNRSEFGPRALGSRSILMSPTRKENKDILNSRVKHREYWRPFAGIILEEHLNDYFYEDYKSPYMLYSLTVKEDKAHVIPAITHVDYTCRIQTVSKSLHPQTTLLLQKLKEKTGIPVVLNTSFNDNGEPIVESPKHAVESFLNLDIDYLVIGNYIVQKQKIKKSLGVLYQ